MNSSDPKNERQNVSFKFNKTSMRTIARNTLEEEKDFVTAVDKKEVKSSIVKLKHKDLVIPLIRKNAWCISDPEKNEISETEKELNDIAVKELLREASEKNNDWENRDFIDAIPLILQNKIPDGFETDDKMDVSLRPNESNLEDYDRVPIDQFGLAMLRGMGWKEGDGIGARNKDCVEPVRVQLRPKGLGLGADASMLKKNQEKAKEEKLQLIKGAYVQITQGHSKGFYGQVLGLDEENARAIVKLANDEKIVTFPEFSIKLVSKKEFDKESKIINRATYEQYKRENEQKEKSKRRPTSEYFDRRPKRERHGSAERTQNYGKKYEKQSSKRSYGHENSSDDSRSSARVSKSWIRPQLRVRFIDEMYKNGRYFNKKVIVEDVLSARHCSCKTEDGTYLDDVSPSMLETLIPHDLSAHVMIVQGKYTGELCTILEKDRSTCVATVQLLSDRDRALRVEYDSICEYVGDVSQFD